MGLQKSEEAPFKLKITSGNIPRPSAGVRGRLKQFNGRPPGKDLGPPLQKLNASLPMTDPNAHFIGGQPYQQQNQPPATDPLVLAGIRTLVGQGYGEINAGVKSTINANIFGKPADPATDEYNRITGGVGQAAAINAKALRGADPDVELPDDAIVEIVRQQARDALRDPTFTADERMEIARAFRQFYERYNNEDPSRRELNNYAIRAEYNRLLAQEQKARDKNRQTADVDQEVAGPNGTTVPGEFSDYWNTYKGTLQGNAASNYGPGFFIAEDEHGYYVILDQDDLMRSIASEARANPAAAAELITKLAAWGAYPGAQEKYVSQNVTFDAAGNPVAGRWTRDDQAALAQFLNDVALQQSGGDLRSWLELLDEHAAQNTEVISGGNTGGASYGGGGGGRRGYGGGGGGFGGGATGVSYTDADQLKQLINAIARARLGYVLPDAAVQEFVSYYHQQESAFVQARVAGQSAMQLDPESQAAAWIESRFRDQMGGQSANTYISQLANFLMGGSFGSTS